MPRYYFHVHDGFHLLDLEGMEYRDLAEARTRALIVASDVLRRKSRDLWDGGSWSVAIADARGKKLCELHVFAS